MTPKILTMRIQTGTDAAAVETRVDLALDDATASRQGGEIHVRAGDTRVALSLHALLSVLHPLLSGREFPPESAGTEKGLSH